MQLHAKRMWNGALLVHLWSNWMHSQSVQSAANMRKEVETMSIHLERRRFGEKWGACLQMVELYV